jgi:hypothetical protein
MVAAPVSQAAAAPEASQMASSATSPETLCNSGVHVIWP